jgi:hypothetical protein
MSLAEIYKQTVILFFVIVKNAQLPKDSSEHLTNDK